MRRELASLAGHFPGYFPSALKASLIFRKIIYALAMPKGGARPGAGRRKGARNKATVEREIRAVQALAGRIADTPKELAIDVLDRMMKVAENGASLHKPLDPGLPLDEAQRIENELAAQQGRRPRVVSAGNWGLFGEWFDRAVQCAKELAKYQSPTFRAIAVTGDVQDKGGTVRFLVEHAPPLIIDAVANEV